MLKKIMLTISLLVSNYKAFKKEITDVVDLTKPVIMLLRDIWL
jgi:hypothetical protein